MSWQIKLIGIGMMVFVGSLLLSVNAVATNYTLGITDIAGDETVTAIRTPDGVGTLTPQPESLADPNDPATATWTWAFTLEHQVVVGMDQYFNILEPPILDPPENTPLSDLVRINLAGNNVTVNFWSFPDNLTPAQWGGAFVRQENDSYSVDLGSGDNLTVTWQSVPEPSTIILLGIGTISLLGVAWRRKRTG